MGYSTTPKYRVEVFDQKYGNRMPSTKCGWDVKTHGRPTKENAEKYRVSLNASMMEGGINAHIGKAIGYIPHAHLVIVIRQSDGMEMAFASMPCFEVA